MGQDPVSPTWVPDKWPLEGGRPLFYPRTVIQTIQLDTSKDFQVNGPFVSEEEIEIDF